MEKQGLSVENVENVVLESDKKELDKEEFRLLRKSEFEEWFTVLKSGYAVLKDYPISFESINATKEEAAVWFSEIPFYGLFVNGRLAASVGIRYPWGAKPGPKDLPHIGWVVTHQDFQGRGLAKKVLLRLENEVLIGQLHAPAVTLGTAKEHPWLVSMYESFGFVPYKTVQLPGKLHHTVFMEKKLILEEAE